MTQEPETLRTNISETIHAVIITEQGRQGEITVSEAKLLSLS